MRFTLFAAGLCTIASAFVQAALMLSIGRGLAGGFFAAAYPASLIYLGDTVPASRRQREVTQLMVGTALGTAMASWGAGLLAEVFSWRAAFVVTGVAALALSVRLGRLPVPTRTRTHRNVLAPIAQALRTRAVALVLLLAFVEGAVLLGVLTLLPASVEAAGASAAVAGAVTGIYGLAVYVSARGVGWLSGRLHPSWLIASGASAALAACAMLSFSRSPAVAATVTLLLGVAWVAMHSSLQTWAMGILPGARATVVSLFACSLFVGSAVAAVVVAGLAEEERYAEIFTLAAVTVIPLGVLATLGRLRWRGPAEDVPEAE
jgi:predicted MFS family arabinose efflux permease